MTASGDIKQEKNQIHVNLYMENYKTFVREIKENIDQWKDTVYLLTGSFSIIKMSIFPKLTYSFNAISIKIAAGTSAEINKLVVQCIWKSKRIRKAKASLKKKKAQLLHLFLLLSLPVLSHSVK